MAVVGEIGFGKVVVAGEYLLKKNTKEIVKTIRPGTILIIFSLCLGGK